MTTLEEIFPWLPNEIAKDANQRMTGHHTDSNKLIETIAERMKCQGQPGGPAGRTPLSFLTGLIDHIVTLEATALRASRTHDDQTCRHL